MPKHVYVLGADDFNLAKLQELSDQHDATFHRLLTLEEAQPGDKDPAAIEHIIQKAEQQLEASPDPVDAIVTYWDYPLSTMLPILCQRYGIPGASLQSVMACEHKYWSRLVQQALIPEHTPGFQSINPFDAPEKHDIQLAYPFWLKPIKAHSSQLGFKINNADELYEALATIRKSIGHFAAIFNKLLDRVEVPPEVGPVDGSYCIAEEILTGRQTTVEGFVHHGEAHTYGMTDIIREPGSSSFAHYLYPSTFPDHIQERINEVSCRLMSHVGYDNATFNIEFFYDEERDRLMLLEINSRISQSHSPLYQRVDGMTNFSIMLDAALGQRPTIPTRAGEFACAGKFFLRQYEDARVTAVPSDDEIRRLRERFPDAEIKITVKEGMQLSELPNQETYSYDLGQIILGAHSEEELLEKHRHCREALTFAFEQP
jgi:biotin carboxylase